MKHGWASEYVNDVYVYDTVTSEFGMARGTSLHEPGLLPTGCGGFPMDVTLPQVNLRGAKIFTIGGECNGRTIEGESYAHYPRLALVGEIKIVRGL